MTLDEIAYNIKNLVEGGISGEDSNLSIRQIRHMIHYHRAQLLLKYTDGGRFVSEPMFQIISEDLSTGVFDIPRVLGFANNRAIKEIYMVKSTGTVSENNKHHLSLINDCDRDFFEASRFTPNRNQFFATISGSQIRVYDNDSQLVNDSTYDCYVSAIFENPTDVSSSTTATYPIPAELVGNLVESVLAKEFGVYLRTATDVTNNSVDDKGARPVAKATSPAPSANARSRKARTR